MYSYYPKGVCSRQIIMEIDENNILQSIKFIGGCSGNLQGISKLVTGMHIDDIITKIKGIQCRNETSCPDQLAQALIAYKENKK